MHVDHVVGVHGGEHQVAGKRGVDGNLRRFGVADFAHHDLVGIVTQDRTQAASEGQAFLFVHRNLGDAAIWYSTGSSIVISLSSSLLISFSAAYRVVVLPDPVGPVTSTMPYGSLM